jgi:NAD(P)-dependent dehydrogenase (short-subunit alcohol dehydrogenase family)
MGRLDGARAVVTGAASGIGAAMARLFVAEGAAVVLCDIDDDRGRVLADELGGSARYRRVDVAAEGALESALELCVSEFGGLDVVCNNAGNPGSTGSILDAEMKLVDQTFAIHLRGVFLGIRAAARVMVPNGKGSIINTASVAGIAANYAGHDYSACKAAIMHLTKTTANELGEYGIRVNAICPGATATPIFARAAGLEGDEAAESVPLIELALADVAPIRRAGLPADIAEAALWLASASAGYVNGQAIAVDGGLTTGPLYRDSHAQVGLLLDALRATQGQ